MAVALLLGGIPGPRRVAMKLRDDMKSSNTKTTVRRFRSVTRDKKLRYHYVKTP